jgi:hypothetical protein
MKSTRLFRTRLGKFSKGKSGTSEIPSIPEASSVRAKVSFGTDSGDDVIMVEAAKATTKRDIPGQHIEVSTSLGAAAAGLVPEKNGASNNPTVTTSEIEGISQF